MIISAAHHRVHLIESDRMQSTPTALGHPSPYSNERDLLSRGSSAFSHCTHCMLNLDLLEPDAWPNSWQRIVCAPRPSLCTLISHSPRTAWRGRVNGMVHCNRLSGSRQRLHHNQEAVQWHHTNYTEHCAPGSKQLD